MLVTTSLIAKKVSIRANILKTTDTTPFSINIGLKREKRNVKIEVEKNHPNSNIAKNKNCPPLIF